MFGYCAMMMKYGTLLEEKKDIEKDNDYPDDKNICQEMIIENENIIDFISRKNMMNR